MKPLVMHKSSIIAKICAFSVVCLVQPSKVPCLFNILVNLIISKAFIVKSILLGGGIYLWMYHVENATP